MALLSLSSSAARPVFRRSSVRILSGTQIFSLSHARDMLTFSHKSLKRLELVSPFFSDVLWDRKVPNLRSLHRRNRFYLFHLDDCARPHRPALSRLIIIIIVWDNSTVDGDCDVDIDA